MDNMLTPRIRYLVSNCVIKEINIESLTIVFNLIELNAKNGVMGYKGLSENSFQSSKRYIITIHFILAIDISRAHT